MTEERQPNPRGFKVARNLTKSQQKRDQEELDVTCCKESIVEMSEAIENSISNLKAAPGGVNVIQLCDKVQLFKSTCAIYCADHVPPAQRFRFRELLTKFDAHADQLKTANNASCNYADLQNTLRDLVNVVQR